MQWKHKFSGSQLRSDVPVPHARLVGGHLNGQQSQGPPNPTAVRASITHPVTPSIAPLNPISATTSCHKIRQTNDLPRHPLTAGRGILVIPLATITVRTQIKICFFLKQIYFLVFSVCIVRRMLLSVPIRAPEASSAAGSDSSNPTRLDSPQI